MWYILPIMFFWAWNNHLWIMLARLWYSWWRKLQVLRRLRNGGSNKIDSKYKSGNLGNDELVFSRRKHFLNFNSWAWLFHTYSLITTFQGIGSCRKCFESIHSWCNLIIFWSFWPFLIPVKVISQYYFWKIQIKTSIKSS